MRNVRKGDFLVPEDHLDRAEDAFEERSERSQTTDKSFRGVITTDVAVYENLNGRVFDYPGVDTPTENPRRGLVDMPFPGDYDRATDADDHSATLAPEPVGIRDGVSEDVDRLEAQGDNLLDAIFGRHD